MKNQFSFEARVQKFAIPAAWYFMLVPQEILEKVKASKPKTIGRGFFPIYATVGKTTWRTSLLPMGDTNKPKRFFIALKAEVRKKESIQQDQDVSISFNLFK